MFVTEMLILLRGHSITEPEKFGVVAVDFRAVEGVPSVHGCFVFAADFLNLEVRVNRGAVFPSLQLGHGFSITFLGNNSILHFLVEGFSLGIDAANHFERGVHNFMDSSSIVNFH